MNVRSLAGITLAVAVLGAVGVRVTGATADTSPRMAGEPALQPAATSSTPPDLVYHSIAPCRVVDTRTDQAPALAAAVRSFNITGTCGIPSYAKAVAVNATAIGPTKPGFMRAWANGSPEGNTILNFIAGVSATSAPVVPIGSSGRIHLHAVMGTGTTNVALDAVGYYSSQIYASISASGALNSTSGRILSSSRDSLGMYTIQADRDLTGCTFALSSSYTNVVLAGYIAGTVVHVGTIKVSGGGQDTSFNITVTC